MRSRVSRVLHASSAALLAACAGQTSGDGAAPGGNVGFGGAQDIGVFRSILESGGIPGPNTLDAAGFFAEHYVDLPPADCGQTLCLQSMLSVGASWLDDGYQATLAVALNTPEPAEPVQERPLDLVVVVDVSGSMIEDDRIGYVKQGLDLLVDQLGADDRMALVTYSTDVSVLADFPAVSETGAVDDLVLAAWREDMHARVGGLAATGSTNIHDGLEAGFELAHAARAAHPGRSQRVILLSDGRATAGITDDESIILLAEGYIEKGVGLTTVGVGRDFNIALMSGLAERGAGNFYFLEDPQAIEEVFTEELDYFTEPLALAVTIEVRAAGSYAVGNVWGTRLWRTQGSVGTMHLPAVFRASRTSDAPGEGGGRRGGGGTLFLDMVPGVASVAGPIAEVRMRFRPVDGGAVVEQSITVANPASPTIPPEDAYFSHEAMAKQHAMYNMFLGLRTAAELTEYDYTCALARLRAVDARAEVWNLEHQDQDIVADRELAALFMENLRAEGARELAEGQSCDEYYEPYPVDDVVYENTMGCSTGPGAGAGAGLAMMLLWGATLAWVGRGRRAPAA